MVCSLHYTDKESAINLLKQHLTKAAGRMKQMVDKRRLERVFETGDMVYLKLKPFVQRSLPHNHHKLSPQYYGPFQVIEKIGNVAYKLKLPIVLHDVFHVSLLKPAHASIAELSSLSNSSLPYPQRWTEGWLNGAIKLQQSG